MAEVGYDIQVVGTDVGLEELDRQVLDEEIAGYVILDDLTLNEGAFAYRGLDSPGVVRRALLKSVVVETVLGIHLSSIGSESAVRQLLDGGGMTFEPLGEEQAEMERITGIATGIAGAMVLYITMLIYGAYVLRAVLDEKRNRVVEVVLSALSPWRLMLGKILGVGLMGLTQVGIWAACAALIGLLGVPMVAAALPAADLSEIAPVFSPGSDRSCSSWSFSFWGISSIHRCLRPSGRCATPRRRRSRLSFR